MNTKIYFAKVKQNAIIPSKSEGDAGYDIYANFNEDFLIIKPHETKMIPTGIASVCSEDYYFQLQERGSTGSKGIALRCGVIDASYRGEWFVPITNTTNKTLWVDKRFDKFEEYNEHIHYPYKKAICQVVLLPVPKVEIEEIDYETLISFKSERGTGLLGSSGK